MFTDPFVRRPVMAIVFSLILIVFGVVSALGLGVQETPDIESPVINVTTQYDGADPAIMESEVTEVLEREINGIPGLRTLSSESRDQVSRITAEFELGEDLEAAANDVRDRVARARKSLPQDVREPIVEKSDADAPAVLYVRIVGDKSLLELSELADVLLRERLQTISGVSRVDIFGERRYAMRVELDPTAMAARGLVLSDIQAALNAGNVQAPAGRIEGLSTDVAMRVDGGLETPEAFANLPVVVKGGAMVRLGDIARIRLGAEDERSAARSDGIPSVSISVVPQAGANIVAISDEVRARLPEIARALPDGVSASINYDRSIPVRTGLRDVGFTLILSVLVVVFVIFAFLRDLRATFVPSVAIAVSLIGTFAFLAVAGFTINVFTLFGLVLAIGIVVDDAIVVLENVQRHVEMGKSPLDAAIVGTREIVFPVLATTATLVVVFLPIVFIGGSTGRLFLEFGATVAVSVVLSGFVALTLTPALSALLLRARPAHDDSQKPMERAFAKTLTAWWRVPSLTVLAIVGSLAAGAWALNSTPRDFFPIEDRNFFLIRLTGPEGVSFPWMDARVAEGEAVIMDAIPERTAVLSRVSLGQGSAPGASNSGMYAIPLVPPEDRTRTQDQIVRSLGPILAKFTAFRAIPIQLPTVGRGFGAPFQLVLQNDDYDALIAALPGFLDEVRAVPGLTGVDVDLKVNRPEIGVQIDRDAAARLGVSIKDIALTMQVLTTGIEQSRFDRGSRQYKVLVGVQAEDRLTPEAVGELRVRSAKGELVPLSALVHFGERSAASARFHYDRAPSATISASLDGIALGTAIDAVRALAKDKLPPGFRTALAGTSKDFGDSTSGLSLVFGLSILLVFLVLAAQFDSFSDPVPILISLPVAIAAGLGGLLVTGQVLTFFAQVGLVLLVGLVTKNGILIVEFANQLRHQGVAPKEAAQRAAILRLRPILMTAASTVGGAIPIALGFSGESRASLGIVVCAGMTFATLLSLYMTPVLWTWMSRLSKRQAAPLITTALVLLIAGRADAGEWTLRDALHAALDADPTVQAAQADADASRSGVWVVGGRTLPSLGMDGRFQYGNSFVSGGSSTGGALTPYANANATLQVPFVDANTWASLSAARRTSLAADARADAVAEGVLAQVAAAWLDLWRAQQLLAVRQADVANATRLWEAAKDRVSVGRATAIESVRAEVRVRQAELAVVEARRAVATAASSLARHLDDPSPAAKLDAVAAPTADLAAAPQDTLRPDLLAARADVDAARWSHAATKALLAPRLVAFAQAGVLSRFDDNGWLPTTALGATATWTGFDVGTFSQMHQRSAQVESARSRLEAVERTVSDEVTAARADLEAATAAAKLADVTVDLATQELALAEDRWRSGAADQLEVVEAQVQLSSASVGRVEASVARERAIVALRAAEGSLVAGAR